VLHPVRHQPGTRPRRPTGTGPAALAPTVVDALARVVLRSTWSPPN